MFVSSPELLETEWAPRGFYGYSARQAVKALQGFCGLRSVTREDAVGAHNALTCGERRMDFADAPHLAKVEAARLL